MNIQGLVNQGYLKDQAKIDAGLTLANATADGEKVNQIAGRETDPAYTIFPDDPLGRPSNFYYGAGNFNAGGIFLDGRKKRVYSGGGDTYVESKTTDAEGIHHIRVADCVIFDNPAGGIGSAKGDYLTIENNVIYDNMRYTRYAGSGISSLEANDFDGGGAYRIFVNGNICHNTVCWVRWTHTSISGTGKQQVAINFSDGNGIIVDTHIKFLYSGRTLIQNNLVYENGGSGIHAFKSGRVDIINNTAFRNSKANSAPGTVLSKFWVQQGTLGTTAPYATYLNQPPGWYADGSESQGYPQIYAQGAGSDVRMRNNILWANAGEPINGAKDTGVTDISCDYNLFGRDGGNAAAGITTAGFTTFAGNIIETTGLASNVFLNSTTPGTTATYLHLKAGSPAANAGNIWFGGAPRNDLNGVRRPVGTDIDIGAFEDL